MMVRKNSFQAWRLATRPKTLVAAAMPVVVGTALAARVGCFRWQAAAICFVFAVLAQVIANFANDYFDYKKGADTPERLGPKRAVAEGWIPPRAMLRVTLALLLADMLVGLSLLFFVGEKDFLPLLAVGVAVAVFALAYSGGRYPLAYHGWGDVCVFIFFGIVPVSFTHYVQTLQWTLPATLCGAAMGLAIINILVANNYRDREQDKQANKRTSIVIFGDKFGRYFYLFNGILAVLCCQYFWWEKAIWAAVLPVIYLFFHIAAWRDMGNIPVLEKSARNVLIFGACLAGGLLL
ncbi:MAG: 1,4-dihydroxy-2-naphthoate octaprenyltransferase [Prevotella sp.]|jgi:1,4-dihydroxy-2-naphthoate octaprenyltransferase|nr:1,4-dihydroxy-2-naphthoate octaprenyltransferase [Prevotella sp.]